jgi:hypothetical protein
VTALGRDISRGVMRGMAVWHPATVQPRSSGPGGEQWEAVNLGNLAKQKSDGSFAVVTAEGCGGWSSLLLGGLAGG